MSMCKVMMIGCLTGDPEDRKVPNGHLTRFRFVSNYKYKKSDGTEVDKPMFIDVEVWGQDAVWVLENLRKGQQAFVEGRLDYQEWEDPKGGGRRSKHIIAAKLVLGLGDRVRSKGEEAQADAENWRAPVGKEKSKRSPRNQKGFNPQPGTGTDEPKFDEADIPF